MRVKSFDVLSCAQDGLSLLGTRWHLDFMREATTWPFGALAPCMAFPLPVLQDFRANRDRLQGWLASGGAPPVFETSPFSTREPLWAAVEPTRAAWRRRPNGAPRDLAVTVFGVHSTLVLEPATMLKAALRQWKVQVRPAAWTPSM